MKRIITLTLIAAALLCGQKTYAQFTAGAGYINSREYVRSFNSENKKTVSKTPYNGFYVGLDYNIKLGKSNWGISPGAYFEMLFNSSTSSSVKTTHREGFLNIPVYVNYNFYVLNDVRGFVYLGPGFNCGLFGRDKSTSKDSKGNVSVLYNDNIYDKDIINDVQYSRFDMNVGAGVGLDFMGMARLTIGYDFGVLNRFRGSADKYAYHRDQLHVGVAYIF